MPLFGGDMTVKKVEEHDTGYSITTTDSTGFMLKKKWGVVPKEGDTVTLHCHQGTSIRGMDWNGVKLFYKTDAELEVERQEWLANYEKEKLESFEKNKRQMDIDYSALPPVFRDRIDRFRTNNPDFRKDSEAYELFCCKQAVVFANACQTVEGLKIFYEAPYEEQKIMVPEMDDGHSGNTFGCAVKLARLFIEAPEFVAKAHGALSPLVGSKAYGDIPKEETNA